MNFEKLFATQRVLREKINYNEPDRFEKLILALLVEVGECANEWRGFKFWSKDQKPKRNFHTTAGATPENAVFFKCMNEDDCGENLYKEDFENLLKEPFYDECPKCLEGAVYAFREKQPLLEEYVDGLHFVLELGIELEEVIGEYVESSYKGIEQQKSWQKAENVTRQFTKVYEHAANLQDDDYYCELFAAYIHLGEMLGFTPEEIEAAYFEKNKVNHERQENGY